MAFRVRNHLVLISSYVSNCFYPSFSATNVNSYSETMMGVIVELKSQIKIFLALGLIKYYSISAVYLLARYINRPIAMFSSYALGKFAFSKLKDKAYIM